MRTAIMFAALITLSACGSGTTEPTTGGTVATVTLTPATVQVQPQHTAQLTATLTDQNGATLTGKTVTWTTQPSGLVSVDASGLVTGILPGTATVTASSGGKTGAATVTVTTSDAAVIGTTGGTVSAAGGKVTLNFPAGAVSSNTTVTVGQMANPPLNARTVASTAYDFGPSGTFAQDIGVAIKYDPALLPVGIDPAALRLYTLVGSTWTKAPNSWVDLNTHTVNGTTSHFSGWITCAYPCATDLPGIDVETHGISYFAIKTGATYTLPTYIYRSNGYTGAVTFTLENPPIGLTMAVQQGATADERNLIFTAGPQTPVGTYQLSIIARGSGIADEQIRPTVAISAPGYSYIVDPTSIPVVQGATATASIAIVRDGANGGITFSATNLPTGVTASFAPTPVTANSTVMTLTALGNAPTGAFNNVVVKGSGAGISDVPTPIAITVISASGFSLTGTPPLASLTAGGSGFTGVKAVRAPGFAGTITYNVTGLVNGLTAAVTTTATADSMKVTFSATAGTPVGNYTANVIGTSGSKSESVPILVTVGSGGTATVQLDLSLCIAKGSTIWLAAQDGNGAFTVVNGTGGLYSFPITSGKGAYTAVVTTGSAHHTYVTYGTPAQLQVPKICGSTGGPGTKVVNFSAVGLQLNDRVDVTFSYTSGVLNSAINTGNYNDVPEGPLDYVAWKYHLPTADNTIRGIIRRDVNIANNGTAAPFDFSSAESFAAVSANGVTTTGPGTLGYYTGPSCTYYHDLGRDVTKTNTIFGVPASAQRATDLHTFGTGESNSTGYRSVEMLFHTMASQSIALGPFLTAPTVTSLSGPYRRLQVAFTLPTEYSYSSYDYFDGANTVTLAGFTDYFGGQSMTLAMPDVSALPGYNVTYFPANGTHGNSSFFGRSSAVFNCSDGALNRQTFLSGTN